MAGSCAVQTLAEFGFLATQHRAGITRDSRHVFIYSGGHEVCVFNVEDESLKCILQFPTSVCDLTESEDEQHLFVACKSAVYCIKLHQELFRAPSTDSSSPPELTITSDHIVSAEEGVLSLLTLGSVLATLSRRDTKWVLTVIKPSDQPGLFETLSSVCIPALSHGAEERKPVMRCVYFSDSSSVSENHLEPALFKLLFGLSSSLIRSPVILCGLPDGRLCSLSPRLPGIRVLHSLEEPVVFIGASVAMETEPGPCARCLVAVGERGRVVVIKTREGATEEEPRRVSFTEGCVWGKVMSACVDESCLYVSTASDVLSIKLEEQSGRKRQESNEERARKMHCSLQSPISLNVSRIIALTKPARTTAGQVELLGLSDKGQLKSITFPKNGGDGESSAQQQTQSGRSVKDLLSAIGDVCERASHLKTSIKSKNQILRRLNQVANVSFLLLNKPDGVEQPIRCRATTAWSRLLQEDSLHLTCVLDNRSPYLLEQGWTLNISVFPLSQSSQEHKTSTNYSFPLVNLNPGHKFEVTLPLTAADDELFPVTISCVLVFSLWALFDEKQLAGLLKGQSSTINLPLNTLAVDWLHALQPTASFTQRNERTHGRNNSSTSGVRAFLKSNGRMKTEKAENKLYSVCLKIAVDLLKRAFMSKSSSEERAPSVCVALLGWLLCEPHTGVSAAQWANTPDTAALQAHGPNAQPVRLSATEVVVGIEKEALAVVEVQVESVSLAAVCGLHHAILSRIQALVKRAPVTSSCGAEALGLRAALVQAEHLLQRVQESRVCAAAGVGVSSGHVTRSLLKVYQDLRQHPLVIF